MATQGKVFELVCKPDKPIKSEMSECDTIMERGWCKQDKSIKSEMSEFDTIMERGSFCDSDEYVNTISTCFHQIILYLDLMKKNPHTTELLSASRQFNSRMEFLLNKTTAYETKFGPFVDGSRQNRNLIGSLAWYEYMIEMMLDHKQVLKEETDKGTLSSIAVGRQYQRNLELIGKLRSRAGQLHK